MTPDMPDDARLEQLIAQAFESLPSPDPRRLNGIAAQLTRRPVFRTKRVLAWLRYWWFVLLFAGAGVATAMWWVLDYPLEEEPAPEVSVPLAPPLAPQSEAPRQSPAAIEQTVPRPTQSGEPETNETPASGRDAVIFRRQR